MENSFRRKPLAEQAIYHIHNEWLWTSKFSGFRFRKKQFFFLRKACASELHVSFSSCGFKKNQALLWVLRAYPNISQKLQRCHGWRWMCVNPFSSITGSLFAYTGHNESLIHCCHLQPTVTLSRINSWSSRAEKGTKECRSMSLHICFTPNGKLWIRLCVDRMGVF